MAISKVRFAEDSTNMWITCPWTKHGCEETCAMLVYDKETGMFCCSLAVRGIRGHEDQFLLHGASAEDDYDE